MLGNNKIKLLLSDIEHLKQDKRQLEKELYELKTQVVVENVYHLINEELKRLWKEFNRQMQSGSQQNLAIAENRLVNMRKEVIEIFRKQPTSESELRQLQDQVADLYLTSRDDDV